MLALSRRIGQKFYIQPIIGDLLVVEIIAIISTENDKKVRLCVTCTDEPKVHRVRKKNNVKSSRQAASPARAGNGRGN
jgi:sRNA-binding carbon storage regulator CsrA